MSGGTDKKIPPPDPRSILASLALIEFDPRKLKIFGQLWKGIPTLWKTCGKTFNDLSVFKSLLHSYRDWNHVQQDFLKPMPLIGVRNILVGLLCLLLFPPAILGGLLSLFPAACFDVGLLFTSGEAKAVSWILREVTALAIHGILRLAIGISQLADTAKLWFLVMPINTIISFFTSLSSTKKEVREETELAKVKEKIKELEKQGKEPDNEGCTVKLQFDSFAFAIQSLQQRLDDKPWEKFRKQHNLPTEPWMYRNISPKTHPSFGHIGMLRDKYWSWSYWTDLLQWMQKRLDKDVKILRNKHKTLNQHIPIPNKHTKMLDKHIATFNREYNTLKPYTKDISRYLKRPIGPWWVRSVKKHHRFETVQQYLQLLQNRVNELLKYIPVSLGEKYIELAWPNLLEATRDDSYKNAGPELDIAMKTHNFCHMLNKLMVRWDEQTAILNKHPVTFNSDPSNVVAGIQWFQKEANKARKKILLAKVSDWNECVSMIECLQIFSENLKKDIDVFLGQNDFPVLSVEIEGKQIKFHNVNWALINRILPAQPKTQVLSLKENTQLQTTAPEKPNVQNIEDFAFGKKVELCGDALVTMLKFLSTKELLQTIPLISTQFFYAAWVALAERRIPGGPMYIVSRNLKFQKHLQFDFLSGPFTKARYISYGDMGRILRMCVKRDMKHLANNDDTPSSKTRFQNFSLHSLPQAKHAALRIQGNSTITLILKGEGFTEKKISQLNNEKSKKYHEKLLKEKRHTDNFNYISFDKECFIILPLYVSTKYPYLPTSLIPGITEPVNKAISQEENVSHEIDKKVSAYLKEKGGIPLDNHYKLKQVISISSKQFFFFKSTTVKESKPIKQIIAESSMDENNNVDAKSLPPIVTF